MNKIDEIVERVLSDTANHGCSYNGIRTIQVTVEEFRGFLQEVVEPFAKDAEIVDFIYSHFAGQIIIDAQNWSCNEKEFRDYMIKKMAAIAAAEGK